MILSWAGASHCCGLRRSIPSLWRAEHTLIALGRSSRQLPLSVVRFRDAAISGPSKAMFSWRVCLKANARNGFGGYTGQTMYSVLIGRNGAVRHSPCRFRMLDRRTDSAGSRSHRLGSWRARAALAQRALAMELFQPV